MKIHRFRGLVFAAKGDIAAAERELRKTVDLNPQNFQAYILPSPAERSEKQHPCSAEGG